MKRRCYICDIDGTIADITHRLPFINKKPKDWEGFFSKVHLDKPFIHMRQLLYHLTDSSMCNAEIVFASGRPERVRASTMKWLLEHSFAFSDQVPLYMRADGDRRDDQIVKYEILLRMRHDRFEPIMAFDDRDRVVKMWRDNGVPCAQVREGNF